MSRWLPTLGLLLGALILPTAVQASGACLGEVNPWDRPTVGNTVTFVGTVTDLQAYEQNALIHVEEVWFGAPLPEYLAAIQIESTNQIASGSLPFRLGDRWVVRGERDGDDVRIDCVATRLYDETIAAHAPPHVTQPLAGQRPQLWGLESASSLAELPVKIVAVALIALAAVGIGGLIRRRLVPA
jgi:hypothetical protein